MPFGGRYRIIDIVLSNFVNSGLSRIKVLTQYKSASLEEHIARAWRLSPMLDNYIETIPAQQRTGKSWFTRLGRRRVPDASTSSPTRTPDHRLHLRRRPRLQDGRPPDDRRAPRATTPRLTVAAIPVPREEARDFGVHRDATTTGASSPSTRRSQNPPTMPGHRDMCARVDGQLHLQDRRADRRARARRRARRRASTTSVTTSSRAWCAGRQASSSTTSRPTSSPAKSERERGYWRDIGTIEAYWEAQMDLVAIHPLFNLYNQRWPIRTGMTPRSAGEVRLPRRGARARRHRDRLAGQPTAASSPAVASIAACSHRGVRINSFSEVEESILFESVNIGRHAQHPPLHHRQGRRDPAGHLDRLRPRGGSQALLRERERHRRHPQARQARIPATGA